MWLPPLPIIEPASISLHSETYSRGEGLHEGTPRPRAISRRRGLCRRRFSRPDPTRKGPAPPATLGPIPVSIAVSVGTISQCMSAPRGADWRLRRSPVFIRVSSRSDMLAHDSTKPPLGVLKSLGPQGLCGFDPPLRTILFCFSCGCHMSDKPVQ
jgi:hypothetical protein